LAVSLTQEREDGSRQESIRRHSRMAHLRSLSPWVRSMRVTKDGRTAHIESEEDIEFILCDARNDTKLSEAIYVGIVKYIGTTSISVTAVAVDPELPDMPTDKQDRVGRRSYRSTSSLWFLPYSSTRERKRRGRPERS